ncbi:uncharacterized protein SCHCODRAFT_02491974 [Schizophyllum commune H4-8]|uniref:uncharacterized protein n=1 Tax=Schizophyllum commune (strain H4-8 / FGSC 9210) TaxID=578458 RepID=UPI00216076F7|nr:uncharacterized protein SCHCODRAFT_02491974 [Schizophyllum commune H4-8]KAI5896700.1 hypothetical protein SCHCODRAFT_02491974 [Schizophyllum commune H4-8]
MLRADLHCFFQNHWTTIVLWMDFLHPVHHVGTERLERVPLLTLCRAFHRLTQTEGPVHEFARETPRLYQLLLLLYLRFDKYRPVQIDKTTVLKCLTLLSLTARQAMWRVDKRPYEHLYGEGRFHTVMKDIANTLFIDAALSAVGHRPRRLYRKVVLHLQLFVTAIRECPDADITLADPAISAFGELAGEVLPIRAHSRIVIEQLVDLARVFFNMPDGRGKNGARLICKLFHTIWMTCYDGRSVAWALRAGVLPLMVALNAEEETKMVSDALFAITGKACHVRVIRALRSSDGEVMSFRGSAFRKPEELDELDRWLRGRADLWHWEYQNQRCHSQQCTRRESSEPAAVRFCHCYNVAYCSKECQRADWEEHRKTSCVNMDWGVQYIGFMQGDLSPLDAHFVACCTMHYERVHAQTILLSIERALQSVDTRPCKFVVMIHICFAVSTYEVHLGLPPRKPGGDDVHILFEAAVGYMDGVTIMQVDYRSLRGLREMAGKQVALGYPKEGYALQRTSLERDAPMHAVGQTGPGVWISTA